MLIKRHEKVDKNRLKFRDQARKIDPNSPDIQHLADSLVQYGQLEDIGVLSDYTVIWGNRRATAALQRPALQYLNAVVLDQEISEAEYRVYQGIENFQQKPLELHEQTLVVAELLRLNPGWTYQDVAKALSIDASMVGKLMVTYDAIEPVREAYFQGRLNSSVFTIAKMPPERQAEALAMAVAGAPRREIESFSRQIRSCKSSTKTSSNGTTKANHKPRKKPAPVIQIPIGSATVSVRGPEVTTVVDVAALLKVVSDTALQAAKDGDTLEAWLTKMSEEGWLATLPVVEETEEGCLTPTA